MSIIHYVHKLWSNNKCVGAMCTYFVFILVHGLNLSQGFDLTHLCAFQLLHSHLYIHIPTLTFYIYIHYLHSVPPLTQVQEQELPCHDRAV